MQLGGESVARELWQVSAISPQVLNHFNTLGQEILLAGRDIEKSPNRLSSQKPSRLSRVTFKVEVLATQGERKCHYSIVVFLVGVPCGFERQFQSCLVVPIGDFDSNR